MLTGDFRLIKNINGQLVINLIREHEIISGSELAQITGMRPSTIFNILKDLSGKDLIKNLGKGESTEKGGKKPYLWKLNYNAAYAIGVDLEIGEINIAILNLGGEVVKKKKYDVERVDNVEDLSDQVVESVKNIIKTSKIKEDKILGLGIAIAGIVNHETGVVLNTDVIPQLNVSLSKVSEEFDFPVVVENNANAAAIGEKWVGSAKGCKNYLSVLIVLGTRVGGLGVGVVINEELYHGASSCSGELNAVLPNFRYTLATFKNKFKEGKILKEYFSSGEKIDIDILIQAAKKKDKVAMEIFETIGHSIGKIVAPAVGLLNPDTVILIGDIAELDDIILNPMREVVEREIVPLSKEALSFITSKIGHFAVAKGAASLILHQYFKVPIIKGAQIAEL